MLLSDARFVQATQNCQLAWQNLRPAPKVTIDFGDGRTMQRTLKGSTVIYLCRPDGTVVDAFPGVYTPEDFLPEWQKAMAHYNDEDGPWRSWQQQPELLASQPRLTASKAIIESPLLKALGEPAPPVPSLDLSRYPLSKIQVNQQLGLPVQASGEQVVIEDSRRYRRVARPMAHRWLAGHSQPPRLEECTDPLFEEVLGVPIHDPWLGLKDGTVPGTP